MISIRSKTSLWSAWEKFIRNTFTPLSIMALMTSLEDEAGPRVATILVFLIFRMLKRSVFL